MDSQGQVVTSDGYLLEPPITVPEDALEIAVGENGIVSVKTSGNSAFQEIGQIELARFVNPAGLLALGRNLFLETDASGAPFIGNPGEDGMGSLVQGSLEMSNVQVVDEMVSLIVAQRAYEASSKAVQAADDLLGIANTLKKG